MLEPSQILFLDTLATLRVAISASRSIRSSVSLLLLADSFEATGAWCYCPQQPSYRDQLARCKMYLVWTRDLE